MTSLYGGLGEDQLHMLRVSSTGSINMEPILRYLDFLPEIEPRTDDLKAEIPEQAQRSVSHIVQHTAEPRNPCDVSTEITAQLPSQPAEFGSKDRTVDAVIDAQVKAQPKVQTPAAQWVRSSLHSAFVPNPHQRQLRPRRPKPAPARQKPAVSKSTAKTASERKRKTAKADEPAPKKSLLVTLKVPSLKRRKVETPSPEGEGRETCLVTLRVPLLERPRVEIAPRPPRWDEISPKTLTPAATAPKHPRLDVSSSSPATKKRRIQGPSFESSFSEVAVQAPKRHWTSPSWSEIYPLLPSSSFGSHHVISQHNLWTEKDEHLLRGKLYQPKDEVTLFHALHLSETLVAYTINRIYSCRLQDLFRYGVRRPLHPTSSFWTSLLRLLPHPYFNSSIALLRYALQSAILYRFPGFSHTTPLMPPYSGSEPRFITHLRSMQSKYPLESSGWERKSREIVQVAEFRCRAQIHKYITSGLANVGVQDKHDLASIMAYRAETDASMIPTELGNSEIERHLFFLTQRDVDFLTDCLDELDVRDHCIQDMRVKSFHSWEYASDCSCETESEASDDQMEPEDIDHQKESDESDHQMESEDTDPQIKTHQWGRKKECVECKPATVASTFDAYWNDLTPEEKGDTAAWREEYLAERRLEILAERREAVIRSRIDASWGQSEHHFGLKHTIPLHEVELLDVPPFDPNPNFSHFERFVNEANLRIIRGNWLTPATKSWFWEHATQFSWDRPKPQPPPQDEWANGWS